MSAYFSHLILTPKQELLCLLITIGCVLSARTLMRLCLHVSRVNPHVYARALP